MMVASGDAASKAILGSFGRELEQSDVTGCHEDELM